jgi:hypothetical protein
MSCMDSDSPAADRADPGPHTDQVVFTQHSQVTESLWIMIMIDFKIKSICLYLQALDPGSQPECKSGQCKRLTLSLRGFLEKMISRESESLAEVQF